MSFLIRKTSPKDLPMVINCEQKPSNQKYVGQWSLQQHMKSLDNKDYLHLVFLDSDNQFAGYAILKGISDCNKSIELLRIAVNEPKKGCGKQVIPKIIQLCFETYGAHRLWLDVFLYNVRAQHVYKSLGFIEEGILRECILIDGKFESLMVMSILKPEYQSI